MQNTPFNVPHLQDLAAGLGRVLGGGPTEMPVAILKREHHEKVSTYPSEVVTCRTADGETLKLLCKYSAACDNRAFGHRGGIAYEAAVYQMILEPLATTAPRYYGTYEDPKTGWTWLVIQYLDGTERVSMFADGPQRAAHWLGWFHARNAGRLACPSLDFLTRYNAAYYRGWVDRTHELAAQNYHLFPGLAELVGQADEIFEVLQSAPATVIHGEFYSGNVLYHDGAVHPIDWESAAIAAGEIDLASLTQGWDSATVNACETAYRNARWPDGAPDSFSRTIQAARIYFLFRWFGDKPKTALIEKRMKWYRQEYRGDVHRWALNAH